MIYEIKKAFESVVRPGIDVNPIKLVNNASAYYLFPFMKPKMPMTIYWAINSVCNLRCKMCDVGMQDEDGSFYKNLRIDKKLHQIDIDVFKSVIDEVAKHKPFIAINSTEPLIYKDITEAVSHCSKRGLKTAVTTGGYNLPSMAEKLVEAGLYRLNVSIDGPKEIHNNIRGRDDSFQQSCKGIQIFAAKAAELNHKCEILVNCTVTNMNYWSLTDLYKEISNIGINSLNITFMWFIDDKMANEHNSQFGNNYPVSQSCVNEFANPSEVDTDILYDQLKQLRKMPNVNIIPNFSKTQLDVFYKDSSSFMNKSAGCLASWFILQILANGEVIVHSRCHSNSFGNIYNSSFKEIWYGSKITEWRKFIKKQRKMPMCKRCDLIY